MELIQRALVTALGALTLFYALVKVSLGYWKRRGILHEKPKFLWGNIKGVVRGKTHINELLQCIYEDYKGRAPFIGCYALLKPFIMVLDLELVRSIILTDAGYFTSRGLYYNVETEPLSGNLLQLDGHSWRRLHAASSSVFTPRNLQKLLPGFIRASRILEERIGRNKLSNLNVSQLMSAYNSEMISSLVYGLDGSQTEFQEMSRSYWNDFSFWRFYLCLEFPLLARLLRQKSYAQLATDYFYNLVQQQLQAQRKRDRQPLQTFLQLYSGLDEHLSDDQIAAQAFGFILAGLEPLNATLSFCLYELALQPDLQQKVRTEIQQKLQQHKGELSAECLKELTYTKQVLNETLRLHTPYPLLLRRATKEFELAKSVFVIARGNNLIIPVAAIHRDPAIYKDPLRFDPDRFEVEAIRTRPAMPFIPFGEGLRGCIGKQLAEQQLLIGLTSLLKEHKYSPCSETQIPLQYDNGKLILTPKRDIQLCVEFLGS